MSVTIEGCTIDELLAVPADDFAALVLDDEPLVFRVGTAEILGRFRADGDVLVVELGHIDGGGEGALPALGALVSRYAATVNFRAVEWRVHAVHCANPNLKLRRVLERRGFVVRDIAGVGECYVQVVAVDRSDHA